MSPLLKIIKPEENWVYTNLERAHRWHDGNWVEVEYTLCPHHPWHQHRREGAEIPVWPTGSRSATWASSSGQDRGESRGRPTTKKWMFHHKTRKEVRKNQKKIFECLATHKHNYASMNVATHTRMFHDKQRYTLLLKNKWRVI